MKNYYSISVPKPCHKDWKTMTPKEKGRFCEACAKTVIDFTKMGTSEIQDFIHKNKNNRICGHFKQTQLDSTNIHIPSQVLVKQQSFHRVFLLALLVTMGTSLMNCTNKNGAIQKIDSIEVVDSINKNVIDVLSGIEKDTLQETNQTTIYPKPKKPSIPEIEGEIEVMGDMITEEEIVLGMLIAENPPEFKKTPFNLSKQEKRDYFSKQITKIISENFDSGQGHLTLTGKQKIFTQFKIDKQGNVIDIKTRAPHPALEKEAKRVIQLLPQFIPAKQNGKPIKVVYTLPIIFQVEE